MLLRRLLFVVILCAQHAFAGERESDFNAGWKFYRGSIMQAEKLSFDDRTWRTLDLPHDWSMDPAPVQKEGITVGPFSKYNEGGAGGADIGQTLGGEGWYRKTFTTNAADANKQFALYIEGVYNQSEVYVNGQKVNFNPYGYISYKVDMTPYLKSAGETNIIAIRVLNFGENSRWYAGSGIFRPVRLIKTDKLHLDTWDSFVYLHHLQKKTATLQLKTVVHNKNVQGKNAKVSIRIMSPEQQVVLESDRQVSVAAQAQSLQEFSLDLPNVKLWSLESPVLYEAHITLSTDQQQDHIVVPFGIRTISFDAEKGFLLNGKSIKLKGASIHHDNGLLGAVAIKRAEERKVELMKANGFNAIRAAHNPPSEAFLDACDRLGMLVIDESFDQWQKPKRANDYHQYFDEWSEHDLKHIVKRDRNHPSIIMWGIGNEIADRLSEEGMKIANRLRSHIHELDTTRAVTAGVNDHWDNRDMPWDTHSERAFRSLDVAGYNYKWDKYLSDHEQFPKRVMYGSESVPKEAHQNWNLVENNSFIIGDFVWTAIDYLGEAGLGQSNEFEMGEGGHQFMPWPWYNAWCGDIDLIGDKKPQSYYRDVLWNERAISMAVQPPVAAGKTEVVNFWGWPNELPSWNWEGRESHMMTVRVYSRKPRVRLYRNGELIGEKETGVEDYTATFQVAYEPGELKAVNVEKGREQSEVVFRTTGKPVAIRLTADRTTLLPSKEDLSYVKIELVDADGNVVTDTDELVEITCDGDGVLLAGGNASPSDMHSFRSSTPKTFRGRAVAIVQPNGTATGNIVVKVAAANLSPAQLILVQQASTK